IPPGGETEHPFYSHCDLFYQPVETSAVNQHEYILIEPAYKKRPKSLCSFPNSEDDVPFRTALTKGVAGIGKTSQVRMILLNWAEGKGNQEVQLIFPLPFRELNLLKDRLNLIELLYEFFPELKEPGIHDLESYRVGFVFDGLDEFRCSLDFKNSPKMTDVMEAFSVPTLLTNLIIGNILPTSQIWITSRPAAVSRIPCQYIHELAEIEGFTDPQKEEFFRRAITNRNQANIVISFLKDSKSLYSLCQIPFICSIAASILKEQYMPVKICELYALTPLFNDLLVLLQMGRHNVKMVDELGELALKQLMKGNTVFYEEDLRECNFDVKVAALYAKVKIPIFREDIGLHQKKIYYFGHTTIQEFFAAMWFLQSNGRQNEVNSVDRKNQIERALWFFRDATHLKCAVDMSLQSQTGHMDLFLRFLLGIAQNFNQIFSEAGFILSTALPETVEYIKKKVMENPASPRTLNLLNCLRELNDYSLENDGGRFLKTGISPDAKYPCAHWSDLAAVLVAENGTFDMPGLEVHKRGDDELLRMLPVVKACQTVMLQYHNLTDKCCEGLASVLTSKVSHLKALDLSFNTLKDSGVELLAAGLAKPHCRLERLNLSGCRVKQKGFAALGKALQSNPSHLRELDLSGNEPGEAGVFHLVDGLKLVKCKLRILKLSNCKLGLELCQALARFLLDNPQPLRELDVSMNNLGDVGLDVLMGGLKFTQINKLELYCCQLTEKCCQHIAKNLVNVTSLRDLNLSNNNLKDEGVRKLCQVFALPNCQLQKLNLNVSSDEATLGCCQHPGVASSLLMLRPTFNTVYNEKLYDRTDPFSLSCVFSLASCGFMDEGCYWLAQGFVFNSTCLKELDISRNHLSDSDLSAFFLFLQTADFPLETLRMHNRVQPSSCWRHCLLLNRLDDSHLGPNQLKLCSSLFSLV
uniref:NACHT domain-containing protein n=1 Tax=Esox lucius TaxID=8010 RepID=A0A6Q2YR79_ESOLU